MDHNRSPFTSVSVKLSPKHQDLLDGLSQHVSVYATEETETEFIFFFLGKNPQSHRFICEALNAKNIPFQKKIIEPQNWNAIWERSFQPVTIADHWHIRAPFHPANSAAKHELVIAPKMAFGTGHHPTTHMMLEQMADIDFQMKRVLDVGCGSGILSIAAEKLGAVHVRAIDYDPLSVENTVENAALNNCTQIETLQSEVTECEGLRYDIVLANINKNVILEQLPKMEDLLFPGGDLLLSGILARDVSSVKKAGRDLLFQGELNTDQWSCLHLRKKIPAIKTP